MLFEHCLQSDQRLFRHGRQSFTTDQDVVVLIQQLRQALAVVLNGLLFLILGWVPAITAIPQMLRLFVKDISNLSRVIGRKLLLFTTEFWKINPVLLEQFSVVLQGELE